jgi:hypothetical protein
MSKTSRDIFPKEKDDKNTIDLCHLNPLKKIWTSDILTSSAKTIQENLSVNIHTFAHVYYVHLGITCVIHSTSNTVLAQEKMEKMGCLNFEKSLKRRPFPAL